MRAHLRSLRVGTLLVGMSLVVPASAQEAPPPAAPPAVVRFEDEMAETHVPTRLSGATDARTEPTDSGQLVAHLPLGAIVTRLASRGGAVLVAFDDPTGGPARLGWVPAAALAPPAAARTTGAAPVARTGMGMVTVHLDAPTGVTLEGRVDRKWEEVCEAPCDVRVPLDAEYRTHGEGLRASASFVLEPVGDRAVVHVNPASNDVGAGVALLAVGGVGVAGGVIGLFFAVLAGLGGNQSSNTIAEVSLGAMGVGALFCIAGGVALAVRPKTTVRQTSEPVAARLPTWSTGLERPPRLGATFALPLFSGSF